MQPRGSTSPLSRPPVENYILFISITEIDFKNKKGGRDIGEWSNIIKVEVLR
ncbi:hypothetical protein TDIS_0756 [Thermosulfurimonas dismutans]|uniref:Uncharacterized protein n=1 Tax=Thermosulfurimonas dismutans TaxID=999894 RepID=A0A179D4T3_9BACT|nr:hypothetical protein TDIS_0756 [Thermosulfurimonas dismutans]